MTSKIMLWYYKRCHEVKSMPWCHDIIKVWKVQHENKSVSRYEQLCQDVKKYIMTAKLTSWLQKVSHGVKITSRLQKYDMTNKYIIKNKVFRECLISQAVVSNDHILRP